MKATEVRQATGDSDYDLLIVGGGMVGASLAIALSGNGLRIGLVEAFEYAGKGGPNAGADSGSSYDDRAIALAYGSRRIFEGMGVWDAIAGDAEAIREIHVSDRGHFGFSHLQASQHGVPALGYVVTARRLGQGLLARLRACEDVDMIAPARVTAMHTDAAKASVLVERNGVEDRFNAPLVVAADGGKSFIREQMGLPVQQWSYGQSAIVANVSPARPHANVAFERFTGSGPLALLPMSEGRCALVWTARDQDVEGILAMSDEDFAGALQRRFGYRLGRIENVGRRASYPLSLLRVRRSIGTRSLVIGNAAHTLHPIAGQGFNLGLRDVAALVDVVLDTSRQGGDIGADRALQAYQRWRSREQLGVAMATDGLARLFANPLAPLRLGRNLGLLGVDLLLPARNALARGAMGMLGRLPRLARGLPPR